MANVGFLKQPGSRLGTTQTIAATTVSASVTNPFGNETYQVRVATTASVYIQVSAGNEAPTASTSTSALLPINWVDYITVTPGQKIAAITPTSTATVTVTEMS